MLFRDEHTVVSFSYFDSSGLGVDFSLFRAPWKAPGRVGGRKRKMTQSKIESAKQLLASGSLPKDVTLNLGISVPTLYRWIPASNNYS